MAKNITIEVNGVATAYADKSIIEVPLTDGSGYGKFQDVDEFDGSGMETQVVGCDASIGSYGGLAFNHTSEGRAVYVCIPDQDPNSSLTANRFAYAMLVEVFDDGAVGVGLVNYNKTGIGGTATLEDGVVTVTGTSGCNLTNTEVQYTVRKIPVA